MTVSGCSAAQLSSSHSLLLGLVVVVVVGVLLLVFLCALTSSNSPPLVPHDLGEMLRQRDLGFFCTCGQGLHINCAKESAAMAAGVSVDESAQAMDALALHEEHARRR